jgi:hypothetical protein
VAWDVFGPKIQNVPAVATDEAGGLPSTLTPDDPVLTWTNYLTNPTRPAMLTVARPRPRRISVPLISAICFATVPIFLLQALRHARSGHGGLGWPSVAVVLAVMVGAWTVPYSRVSVRDPLRSVPVIREGQADEILHALLYNVYRAFDHRDERLVYDRLALSISGDLLTDIYLQVRRSMELANQGGARVKIDDVEVLNVAECGVPSGRSFAFQCRWNASGSVGHWGHIHRRTNQYNAVLTIETIDERWKITSIEVDEERRVDPGINGRIGYSSPPPRRFAALDVPNVPDDTGKTTGRGRSEKAVGAARSRHALSRDRLVARRIASATPSS